MENVRGHLSLGGTTVIADLATIGYDAEWRIVSAASVGANHRRDRIIIVAYPNNERREGRTSESESEPNGCGTNESEQRGQTTNNQRVSRNAPNVADPNHAGNRTSGRATDGDWSTAEQERQFVAQRGFSRRSADVAHTASSNGRNTESHGVCTVYGQATELGKQGWDSGSISSWWQVEPDVGRVANGVPNRVDRLRGLGNAVVPQVAEVIGRLVIEHATHN